MNLGIKLLSLMVSYSFQIASEGTFNGYNQIFHWNILSALTIEKNSKKFKFNISQIKPNTWDDNKLHTVIFQPSPVKLLNVKLFFCVFQLFSKKWWKWRFRPVFWVRSTQMLFEIFNRGGGGWKICSTPEVLHEKGQYIKIMTDTNPKRSLENE